MASIFSQMEEEYDRVVWDCSDEVGITPERKPEVIDLTKAPDAPRKMLRVKRKGKVDEVKIPVREISWLPTSLFTTTIDLTNMEDEPDTPEPKAADIIHEEYMPTNGAVDGVGFKLSLNLPVEIVHDMTQAGYRFSLSEADLEMEDSLCRYCCDKWLRSQRIDREDASYQHILDKRRRTN